MDSHGNPIYKIHRTFLGRTAGGWLRRAEVRRSLAGNWQIYADRLLLAPAACGTRLGATDGYRFVHLSLSPCALRRLTRLEEFVHTNTQHDIRSEPDYDIRRDCNHTPDGEKR